MPSEERRRDSSSQTNGQLQSPFLEEDLFLRETDDEWAAPLAGLEAESPFLHAFELDRASRSKPEGSEEEDGETQERSAPDYIGKLPQEVQFPQAEAADAEEDLLTVEVERDQREVEALLSGKHFADEVNSGFELQEATGLSVALYADTADASVASKSPFSAESWEGGEGSSLGGE
jgi:hypothetical protein